MEGRDGEERVGETSGEKEKEYTERDRSRTRRGRNTGVGGSGGTEVNKDVTLGGDRGRRGSQPLDVTGEVVGGTDMGT